MGLFGVGLLGGLLVFLVGALVVAVVIYVVKLLVDMIELPEPIKRIGLLIIGLILLVIVIMLAINVASGGEGAVLHL